MYAILCLQASVEFANQLADRVDEVRDTLNLKLDLTLTVQYHTMAPNTPY